MTYLQHLAETQNLFQVLAGFLALTLFPHLREVSRHEYHSHEQLTG
jgi:hypothetical protein